MNPTAMSDRDVLDKFTSALAGAGLSTSDRIVGDGELQRFHVEGDPPKTRNGWYVLFLDTDETFKYPAAEFGCWKRGIQVNWCARSDAELTPVEHHEIRKRIEAARQERAEKERQLHDAVAREARRVWDAAAEHHTDDHPYLVRKGVKSYGLRVGAWPNGTTALMVPVQDGEGKMVSLQAIFQNVNPTIGRDKDFLKGGKKRGCWFPIGAPPAGGDGIVILCEGYATGASLHQATGLHVAVAFDAGNLKAVAYELRRRWPACAILVAADNDRWTVPTVENPHVVENPGVTYARAIGQAIPARVLVAIPEFASLDGKPTDYNDLHAREGIDAVRAQIMAVVPKPEAGPDDEDGKEKPLPLDAIIPPFCEHGFRDVSDKGQPLNTVENVSCMLAAYGIEAKYNQVRKAVEVTVPGRSYTADNRANCSLAEITSIAARNRMPQSMLSDYIKLIADRNAYNPVCDWIESKPWDGISRIGHLQATIRTAGDVKLKDALIYRWLLSAVAAAFMVSGFESHGCLVLTGAQGTGKTTWFRRLAPTSMGLVLTGAIVDPADKDTVTAAVGHWIVELGELDATFRKADIARLKSFITKPVDKLRRPYDRVESEYQRRTVLGASVNDERYLVDDTGNRRWWTINVESIDYNHQIDMQQLWSEILLHHKRGEQHHLTPEENDALGGLNAEHEAVDPIEEMILSAFEWGTDSPVSHEMTASEVLVAIGFDKPNKAQATHASKLLKKLTKRDPTKRAKGRYFEMPSRPRGGRATTATAAGDDDLKAY